MFTPTKQMIPTALALGLAVALLPQTAEAQEQEGQQEAQQECAVEVSPQKILTGQPAVPVEGRLTQGIGDVNSLEAGESGLALASPEDIGRTEMARTEGEEAPRPVEMSRTGNQARVWLNTKDVEPGTHGFVLVGENATCAGEIEVAEKEENPEQDDT